MNKEIRLGKTLEVVHAKALSKCLSTTPNIFLSKNFLYHNIWYKETKSFHSVSFTLIFLQAGAPYKIYTLKKIFFHLVVK